MPATQQEHEPADEQDDYDYDYLIALLEQMEELSDDDG